MSIVAEGLLKQYGSQKAVNGISFRVEPGEITGFLGPNGAGKSTTLKMMTGFLTPDAGRAVVAGVDVARDPIAAKQRLGYLPEHNPLYLDMFVKEYLRFVAGLYRLPDVNAEVAKVIELTGLGPEQHKKTGQLSKGYRQRVGLAAALVHHPEVLILDEPTTGLDPNQIIEIRNVIREQGRNKTVLFSSHILQEVQAICQRIIILHKGNLVLNERMDQLSQRQQQPGLRVQFAEALESQWLERLPGVSKVEKMDAHQWRIFGADPAAMRRSVMQLSLDHQLNIVQLQNQSANLEELFASLTGQPQEKSV